MIVKFKRKISNFSELFPTFDEFRCFMKDVSINLENFQILEKFKSIYERCYVEDIVIHNSNLKKFIVQKFNFKFKNNLQVEFWEERGYSDCKDIVFKIQSERSKKVKNRFVPNLKNLENIGYSREIVNSWRSGPNFIKYWINKGYSEDEAIFQRSNFQKNSNKFIDYDKRISNNKLDYYLIRGYTEDESKKMLSERQNTIKIETYVSKYGLEEGSKIFRERINNRSEYLICSKKGYSEVSQDLFQKISEIYEDDSKLFFAKKNKEYKIKVGNSKFYLFDFVDIENKKIIEFQGDKFHANPNLYRIEDKPHPFLVEKTSKEIWDYDLNKKIAAESHNFEVFYVWESEYISDKDKVLEMCLIFLNKKN